MRVLTRDEIFAAKDLPSEEVPVPEWGEDVCVRVQAMSAAARTAFYAPLVGLEKEERLKAAGQLTEARLAVFTVVDDAGKLLFSEEDIPKLGEKSPEALERIAEVGRRLNGLTGEAVEEAKKA